MSVPPNGTDLAPRIKQSRLSIRQAVEGVNREEKPIRRLPLSLKRA
jgi:hypothetical protein